MIFTNIFSILPFIYCDTPENAQLGIQDPATSTCEGMIIFHDYLMFFVFSIGTAVFWLLLAAFNSNSSIVSKFSHSNVLEIVWTIIPAIILIFITFPSFSLLYSLEDKNEPDIIVKIIGHQWYWTYEIPLTFIIPNTKEIYTTISFDAYILNTNSYFKTTVYGPINLAVDNYLVLPVQRHIKLLITSADVLHSWAVPSLGVKLDAVPGRLSLATLFIKREGIFFGQCSEICGINHGFMPIGVRAIPYELFLQETKRNLIDLSSEIIPDFFKRHNENLIRHLLGCVKTLNNDEVYRNLADIETVAKLKEAKNEYNSLIQKNGSELDILDLIRTYRFLAAELKDDGSDLYFGVMREFEDFELEFFRKYPIKCFGDQCYIDKEDDNIEEGTNNTAEGLKNIPNE